MQTFLWRLWAAMRRPSAHYSLSFLTLGGFVCGILFWGGFNTALEATNTETFCIGCHEMETNVYLDLQRTVHFANASGVRAECPDCHVPHEWTTKIARKIAASKEVYGWLFGTINTAEKFDAHRLTMAPRMGAVPRQRQPGVPQLPFLRRHGLRRAEPARGRRAPALRRHGREDCIDCHAGIAHRLPEAEPGAGPASAEQSERCRRPARTDESAGPSGGSGLADAAFSTLHDKRRADRSCRAVRLFDAPSGSQLRVRKAVCLPRAPRLVLMPGRTVEM